MLICGNRNQKWCGNRMFCYLYLDDKAKTAIIHFDHESAV